VCGHPCMQHKCHGHLAEPLIIKVGVQGAGKALVTPGVPPRAGYNFCHTPSKCSQLQVWQPHLSPGMGATTATA
jgi:hypothetical protein